MGRLWALILDKHHSINIGVISFMSIVFDNEFLRSKNKTSCNDVSKKIIKEFFYPNVIVHNESAAQLLCENYCSRKTSCWGCILYCGRDCKYIAISGCDREKNDDTESFIMTSISQKPGPTKLYIYHIYIYITQLSCCIPPDSMFLFQT